MSDLPEDGCQCTAAPHTACLGLALSALHQKACTVSSQVSDVSAMIDLLHLSPDKTIALSLGCANRKASHKQDDEGQLILKAIRTALQWLQFGHKREKPLLLSKAGNAGRSGRHACAGLCCIVCKAGGVNASLILPYCMCTWSRTLANLSVALFP